MDVVCSVVAASSRTPAEQCPNEILSDILDLVVDSSVHLPDALRYPEGRSLAPFLPLHHNSWSEVLLTEEVNEVRSNIRLVCHRWDEIVISTPRCWRTIAYTGRHSQDTLRCWIRRARNVPLNVILHFPIRQDSHSLTRPSQHLENTEVSRKWCQAFLVNFLAITDRIQHMELTTYCSIQMDIIMHAMPSILTGRKLRTIGLHLRRKCIPLHSYNHLPHAVRPLDLGYISGPLQDLFVSVIHIFPALKFPTLIHIRTLEIHFENPGMDVINTWEALTVFLGAVKALKVLRLGIPWNPVSHPGSPPIILPTLESFTLALMTPHRATEFLGNFVIPSLKHLSLTFYSWSVAALNYTGAVYALTYPAIRAIRTYPSILLNLQTLVLTWLVSERPAISAMLHNMVKLETLVLHNMDVPHCGTSMFMGEMLDLCIRTEMSARAGKGYNGTCPNLRQVETYGGGGLSGRFLREARRRVGLPVKVICTHHSYMSYHN